MRSFLVLLTLSAGLVGCANGPGGDNYLVQEHQLAQDCQERGGILASTGKQTGRPQVDNVCKITGGPSDRLRPN